MNIKIVMAALVFCGVSFLTACSSKATSQAVYTSESTLTVLETAASQYAEGSFGTPKASVIAQIKAYDEQVYDALIKIRTSVEAGDSVSTTDKVALTLALTAFQQYLVQQNIINSGDIK